MNIIVKIFCRRWSGKIDHGEDIYHGDYKLIKYENKYYWSFYSYDQFEVGNTLIIDRDIDNVQLPADYVRDPNWNFLFLEEDLDKIKYEYSS